jgi:uncharacterized protein (TIGR03067 family)
MVALPGNAGVWAETYLRKLFWSRLARVALLLVGLMLLVGGLFLLLAQPPPSDRDLIQGTWPRAGVQFAGQPMPAEGIQFVFTDDKCTLVNPAGQISADYKLDPRRTPKAIDLTPGPGVTWPGIYEVSANTLRLAINHGGPDRPTDFVSQPGTRIFVYTLER